MFISFRAFAQSPFVHEGVFDDDYFIENKGQFPENVRYAMQNASGTVFIYTDGFEVQMQGIKTSRFSLVDWFRSEEERERREELGKRKITCPIRYSLAGNNNSAKIILGEKSTHYFSFGETQFQSYGYKTLDFIDVYPGIDLHYEIPSKGGLKYYWTLHSGADLNAIQFKYSGENTQVQINDSRIQIENPVKPLFDYLQQVHSASGEERSVRFVHLANNYIGFQTPGKSNGNETWIIDPWVTTLSTLTSATTNANLGYDIDYDNNGNVFVYGGGNGGSGSGFSTTNSIKIARFNAAGVLQWTFSGYIPSISWYTDGATGEIGNMYVQKTSGKVFVGNGYSPTSGTTVIRLDTLGNYDGFKSTPNSSFSEIWDMTFDCKTGKILAMGGSLTSSLNLGIIDTTTYATSISNFTGISGISQDIVSSSQDPFGNFYTVFASKSTSSINNHICRLNASYNGFVWNVASGFNTFLEAQNKPYTVTNNFYTYTSNGYNALYANSKYLFYYDGYYIKAFAIANGATVGTYTFISGYSALYQGGIYADECNNVYIGGTNGTIKVFSFNGTTFTFLQNIVVSGLNGRYIYDLKFNSTTNLLNVCGAQFVGAITPPITCIDTTSIPLKLTTTCNGTAQVMLTTPDPTFTYDFIWRDTLTNSILRHIAFSHKGGDTITALTPNKGYKLTITRNQICSMSQTNIPFTMHAPSSVSFTDSICLGDTLYVGGKYKHTIAGNFNDTLANQWGCDSVISLTLKYRRRDTLTFKPILCQGDSFKVASHFYKITGTFFDTLTNKSGCDSIIRTDLIIRPKHAILNPKTICAGDSVVVGIHAYKTAGVYVDTLKNQYACDSIITTTLVVNSRTYFNQTKHICQGQSYTIGKHSYSVAGNYSDTLLNVKGCDSVVTTALQIHPIYSIPISLSLCHADTVYIGSFKHYQNGHYIDTLHSISGCDSIIQLDLAYHTASKASLTFELCQGKSVKIGKHSYTSSGTYQDTIPNVFACDSIITSTIQVHPVFYQDLYPYLCANKFFEVGAKKYNQAGDYYDTLASNYFCDSIIHTHLSILPVYAKTQTVRTCVKGSYSIGLHTYTVSGVYIDSLLTMSACDSVVTTHVIIPDSMHYYQTIYRCDTKPYIFGIHSYNQTGIYIDTLKTSQGCDSLVTTDLHYVSSGVTLGVIPNKTVQSGETVYLTVNTKNLTDTIYKWYPSGEIQTVGPREGVIHPAKSTLVIVYTKTKEGCIAMDSVYLNVLYINGMHIPTAFTPNGDKINDEFEIIATSTVQALNYFRIYNRWGELVFESSDIHFKWDGTVNGVPCPSGVYVWTTDYVDVRDGLTNKSGNLTLLR